MDLSIEQFMQIQRRLLREQIELLNECELGQKLLSGQKPASVEEFLEIVPITVYDDYLPWLLPKHEEALPMKPHVWMRTSGKTGTHGGKWVPVTRQFYDQLGKYMIAPLILASAKFKGDVRLEKNDVLLYTVAPPPYISGTGFRAGGEEFPLRFVPSIAEAEAMDFQERMEQGFLRSLDTGIDFFMSIASVLLRIGETFAGGEESSSVSKDVLRPRTLYRLGKAYLRSKLQGRQMLPQDIWNPKGIVVSGMDVQIYKSRIRALWGTDVLEAYACTEFVMVALQSWGAISQGMTLTPDNAFWEFMPEAEYRLWREDKQYKPKTFLLDHVPLGKHVIVGTSFHGGAFIRYILGDLINVISLKDESVGIRLPQIVMESRVDDIIDLGSLVRLSERAVWQAIGATGFNISDWIARKELDVKNDPIFHMYIEVKNLSPTELDNALHTALMEQVEDFAGYEEIMGINPLRVTILSQGTFQEYIEQKQAEGADLGHWKPPRMQPSDEIVQRLLNISKQLAD